MKEAESIKTRRIIQNQVIKKSITFLQQCPRTEK
jgi:hypothetical protein